MTVVLAILMVIVFAICFAVLLNQTMPRASKMRRAMWSAFGAALLAVAVPLMALIGSGTDLTGSFAYILGAFVLAMTLALPIAFLIVRRREPEVEPKTFD